MFPRTSGGVPGGAHRRPNKGIGTPTIHHLHAWRANKWTTPEPPQPPPAARPLQQRSTNIPRITSTENRDVYMLASVRCLKFVLGARSSFRDYLWPVSRSISCSVRSDRCWRLQLFDPNYLGDNCFVWKRIGQIALGSAFAGTGSIASFYH